MSPQALGELGEAWARAEYTRRGFTIVAQNEFNRRGKRLGEIDFIAANRDKIVFVEVKTRSAAAGKFGGGAEAVDRFKQLKLLKAVKMFLARNPAYRRLRPEIDVCLVVCGALDKAPESVTIIPNAVEDFS